MKKITLEDVNNAIIGTDIKILSTINILDLSNLNLITENLFGVYIIHLKYKESYIGMSSSNKGIQGRLLRHTCETWHRNIIESIDIFITNSNHVSFLERILIKTFNPELNSTMYSNCSLNQFQYVQKELELDDDNCNLIDERIDCNKNIDIKRTPIPLYKNNDIYSLNEPNQYENEFDDVYNNNYKNESFINWLKKQKGRNDPIGDVALVIKNNNIRFIEIKNYEGILNDAFNEYNYIYLNTNYRNISENFGLISIESLNPELRLQLDNDKNFDYNYKIICKKYDEIKAVNSKNQHNVWEERIYKERLNDNLGNEHKIKDEEWTKERKNIREIWKIKQNDVEKNYIKLLLELKNELESLLKKYGKNIDYIKESYYNSLIEHDIDFINQKMSNN